MTQHNPEMSVHDIFDELEKAGETSGYTIEDFRDHYHLTEQEAGDLKYLIDRKWDESLPEDTHPDTIPSWVHKEYWHETSFGDFEGFTEHEKITILKYYDDLRRYWAVVRNEPDRDPVTGRQSDPGTYGSAAADQ